ncbi:AAA family ATPase [Butyrivibrio sp. WCE2006]|uniref:AAA family ATPase n=1 Tax=Butyrivibrio sp. WCE2006 TaxID=1410611 RepID=UPI0005D2782B|nr:ATP-binding protein [Butyrivibrio sp. WCE2006]
MLLRVEIDNFKNFNNVVFDLSNQYKYEFNQEAISKENGCITKGIIYGENGSGKSNLGLAIFDLVAHLTDNEVLDKYSIYTNLNSKKKKASFKFEFVFDGKPLVYSYKKYSLYELVEESVIIDGEELIAYDYQDNSGFTKLKGTENLTLSGNLSNNTSRVKYILNTALLEDNEINKIFLKFGTFVNRMLLFYSLETRGYQGFTTGTASINDGILRRKKLKDFESFLKENDIDYSLIEMEINGVKQICCNFDGKIVSFFSIASTGTSTLALFYYWYIQMQEASLVFIDEFDAFYHFSLSKNIVRMLKELTGTQVFLTTHNTDIMSNDLLRPDCYFEINKKIECLADKTEKDLRKAHNLQKMYKAGAFNE